MAFKLTICDNIHEIPEDLVSVANQLRDNPPVGPAAGSIRGQDGVVVGRWTYV
jgi:hypothetical protein